MLRGAPLNVTVEIRLLEGPRTGERRFRLSHRISLPPTLAFNGDLPVEGQAGGTVSFWLPDGDPVQTPALLRHDPEHPERGSVAELANLPAETLRAIETYIEEHERTAL